MSPASDPRTGGFTLWFGVSAGIVAWLAHLSAMAAFTPYVCHSGDVVWFHALSVGLLVPTALAGFWSWRHWQDGGEAEGVGFLGGLGVILNGLMALAILAEWVPVFILDACVR